MNLRVSEMAETLIGSEIIKLGGEINQRIKEGAKINNFTIGDFDPAIFPIPSELTDEIINAYKAGHTNYPPADGMLELRKAVSDFLSERENLNYNPNQILIAGGARPIIYSIYQTIVDPGDKVIFPVPSWNNNHYCHLSRAQQILVEATPENNFMPVRSDLEKHAKDAVMIAVCSPLNPTGTVFSRKQLEDICDLVLEENARRSPDQKPLYLLYDQIYWLLTFGGAEHYNPVQLRPEMANYTLFVDGISKAFAATGVRVGWSFGPERIMAKMRSILGHIGAWAPKAEQVATAAFLQNRSAVDTYLNHIKKEVYDRQTLFFKGFKDLKAKGFPVDIISPEGAIYLSVQFSMLGAQKADGTKLNTTFDIASYLIAEASFAVVPFTAFGNTPGTDWFRISVGTCRSQDIPSIMNKLKEALLKLK
jgi:aspartate aminotransferase